MPHEPTPIERRILDAMRRIEHWMDHKWAIPMLLALWRGPMKRKELHATMQAYLPDSNLTPTEFTRTGSVLEGRGLVGIIRSPEHPTTQEGAEYEITERTRVELPPVRDTFLHFMENVLNADGHHADDTAVEHELRHQ